MALLGGDSRDGAPLVFLVALGILMSSPSSSSYSNASLLGAGVSWQLFVGAFCTNFWLLFRSIAGDELAVLDAPLIFGCRAALLRFWKNPRIDFCCELELDLFRDRGRVVGVFGSLGFPAIFHTFN